jgi:hypothetical protein
MMRRFTIATLCVAAIGLAACGDNFQTRACATGTVPDPSGANACVPDGSVICGQGTVFNMTTGKCDSAGDQCPAGTVLVNDECVTSAKPDAEEGPEENDADGAGEIIVPAAGAPGFVIHGCITPRDDGATADVDPWFVTVEKPTLLEVTADGVGGLSAGFIVQTADPALTALKDAGWVRFGVNLTGDTSKRQLFLPAAGSYALVMADSRQLFLQEAVAGSDKTCYFTTVKQLEIPTPTALTASFDGTIGGEVQFYTVSKQEGDLIDVAADMPSGAANGSVVVVNNDEWANSAEESTDPFSGAPVPAEVLAGGLKVSDDVLIAIDTEYNYAIAPVDFSATFTQIHAQALPANGTVTTTEDANFFTFVYFDVAKAGDIIHFDLQFADPAIMRVAKASNLGVVVSSGNSTVTSLVDWVRFPTAGRYYVMLYHPSVTAGDTTDTTSKLDVVTPEALTVGTPVTGHTTGALNSAWFTFDPTSQTWVKISAGATNFGGNVKVTFYPATGVGRFGTEILPAFPAMTFNPNGTQAKGRITFGDPTKYIVRVEDAGAPASGETFNLSIAQQTFTNLGLITDQTPKDTLGEDLGGTGKTKLYFVRAPAGDTMTITVHPTANSFNASIVRLNVDETSAGTVNAGAAGADETLVAPITGPGWIAFAVTGTGAATTYDLHVSVKAPIPYTQATGTLAFADICNGGANEVTMSDSDEGLSDPQTAPFTVSLFGDDVTDFTIATNGFLSFGDLQDSFYANAPIPTEDDPNGLVAPYWSDLQDVVVCMTSDANAVTVQWTGAEYGGFAGPGRPVEFQAVIHKDGKIDFIYGAGQVADGNPATVGLENLYGTFGNQASLDTAGSVAASTSRTFTPAP